MKTSKNTLRLEVDKKTFESIKQKGSLSAKEFRELALENKQPDQQDKHFSPFVFNASFLKSDEDETVLEIRGRHSRKNEIDTWGLRRKIQYKKALRDSVLLAKTLFKGKLAHYNLVTFEYDVYNPKSRDDDANFNTLKILRDSIVLCGIIDDDKRKIVKDSKENEILSKEWKIVVKVKKV